MGTAVDHPCPAIAGLTAPAWPLDDELASRLRRDGYAIVEGHAERDWYAAVGARIDELVAAEGPRAAHEHHREDGVHRLANLVNKGAVFDRAWLDPLVLACCAHLFVRDFKLSSLNAREALPGGGHQGLHADWKTGREPGVVHVANALWAIDDCTVANGAPRLVPRTHRLPGSPAEHLADPAAEHPEQIVAEMPAGSVLIIDAHTWHGGTANRDGSRRRILHAYYTAREDPQQQDQRRWIRAATRDRLPAAALWLLDVERDVEDTAG